MAQRRMSRLVLGVTGHRNVDEKSPLLRKAVRAAIAEVLSEFDPRILVAVSPLAEGADRLVAREALRVKGSRLFVPLPVPQLHFEDDFPKTVGSFRALLKKAGTVIDAPLPKRGHAWMTYSKARDHQYAWTGAYVVRHCHVLIAIWDGKPARGTGGTAQVVSWFRKGLRARSSAVVPARYQQSAPVERQAELLPPVPALKLVVIRPDGTRMSG
jgi:hypothetical protein